MPLLIELEDKNLLESLRKEVVDFLNGEADRIAKQLGPRKIDKAANVAASAALRLSAQAIETAVIREKHNG